jgi:casein kinase 1 epsilon
MLEQTDEVYSAYDILSGHDVVVKLERVEGKDHTLGHEFQIYTTLNGGTGIAHVHWFGMEAGFDVMVVNRLSHSLEDLFVHCDSQFTIKTVLFLAVQLVCKSNL